MQSEQSLDSGDEAGLIRKVLAGEREAFGQLVLAYQEQVFAMIMRQVGDEEIAEDLAQETFLRAYKYLASFEGKSSFSTWLIRIALNRTNSYFSSKRYRQMKQTKTLDEGVVEGLEAVAEEKQFSASEIYFLREVISSLKPKHREVLTLVSFEGKTYREAADILAVPPGTVASRMNKALQVLRKKMRGLNGQ